MKNSLILVWLFVAGVLSGPLAPHAVGQVGIGTPTPDAKAALDIRATNKGLLIPRLTAGQRAAITSPPQGLMVYQTDGTASGGPQTGFWYYAGIPAAWVFLDSSGDNLGNHTATQNLQLGTNQLLGNGGTVGLRLEAAGDAHLGKTTSWQTAADDRVLKFGDSDYVTVGEAGGDDLMQLRAKTFSLLPSSAGYTGAVGIGTATPASALHVYSAASPTVLRVHSSGAFGQAGLDFYSDPEGAATEWRPSFLRSTDAGSYTGGLAFYTNGTGAASKTGSLEGMRLVNGRLGIGATAPFSQLANTSFNVVGADGYGVGERSLTWVHNTVGYAAAIYNSSSLSNGRNGLAVKVTSANATTAALDVSQGTTIDAAGSSLLRVRGDGHVGIGSAAPNVRVSWQVTGARQDKWAQVHPIDPEEPKTAAERGHFLLPELYGRPASEGIVPPPATEAVRPAQGAQAALSPAAAARSSVSK